jgi:hypothetical protein
MSKSDELLEIDDTRTKWLRIRRQKVIACMRGAGNGGS